MIGRAIPQLTGHKVILFPFDLKADFDLFVDLNRRFSKELHGTMRPERINQRLSDTIMAWQSGDLLLWTGYTNHGTSSERSGFLWLEDLTEDSATIFGLHVPAATTTRKRKDRPRVSYAEEAIRLIVAYAFETMNLVRISSEILDTNPLSMNLLERSGFQREGILRSRGRIEGKLHDTHLYATIRKEVRPDEQPVQASGSQGTHRASGASDRRCVPVGGGGNE